jgi:putative nucleotidyltransferase with HDIG domain
MVLSVEQTIGSIARAAGNDPALREAVLVGGAVRDLLLGHEVTELDVASATPAKTAVVLAGLAGSEVVPIGGDYDLRRVPLSAGWIDVTPMLGELSQDLARRDYTVNALALPLAVLTTPLDRAAVRSEVVDRFGGVADLDAGLVRQLTPTAISDDPVRALRGIRLATRLGFAIDRETAASMASVADALPDEPDRVGAELALLFADSRAAAGVRLLAEVSLLETCFPELTAGQAIDQRPHHSWDVLEHQLRAAEWVGILLDTEAPTAEPAATIWHLTWDRDWPDTRWGPVREHLGRHAATLRLATLLHDIGKPLTRTIEPDGRTRFFHHGPVGADLASARLRQWRFSQRTIERVALLLNQHLRPGQIAAPGQPPTARALHRFHRRLGDTTPDVCLLFLADSLATAPIEELLPRWPAYVAHVQRIACWREPDAAQQIARIVDGHAVIEATGLAPGPAIGAILEGLAEAAAAGEVEDASGAIELARRLAAEFEPDAR